MDHEQYREWLSGIDRPSPARRRQAEAVPSGGWRGSASLAAIEAAVGEDRRCLHCGTPGAVSRGRARGRRRYRCRGCGKTFGNRPSEGMTVRASAGHCRLAARQPGTRKLTGIVEPGGTHVPESRKARRHGGKAGRRGLSDERAPVPTLPTAAA